MNKPTNSENYRTARISYPPELNLTCPVCGNKVKFQELPLLSHTMGY
ncbi:MAG: hypothetical protein ACOC4M_17950 [Promethearchaeia archaeon]